MSNDDYGIGAAAEAGLALGRAMRSRADLRSWQSYAAQLEAQLSEAKQRAFLQQKELDLRESQVVLKDIQLINAGNNLTYAEQMLAFRESELEETRQELGSVKSGLHNELQIRDRKLVEMSSEQASYREEVGQKVSQLERALRSSSAMLVAYETIYKTLTDEIKAIDDPSRFEALDFKKRRETINRAWDSFLATGKISYDCDMLFIEDRPRRPANK